MRQFSKICMISISLFISTMSFSHEASHPLTIDLTSVKGEHLLLTSQDNQSFWPLVRFFVAEKFVTYCGVASSVAVLNALGFQPQADIYHAPYAIYNQDNVFSAKVLKNLPTSSVLSQGMSLTQLQNILQAHSAHVKKVWADQGSYQQFMQDAIQAVLHKQRFIIVNFLRTAVGQVGGGHFSPLGAYNKQADAFLVMDVARYKYPPTWIKSRVLWNAINTTPKGSKHARGYLIVSR